MKFRTNSELDVTTEHSQPLPIGDIDIPKILSRLSGDRELLAELVDIYREDYPILISEIERAVAQRNGKKLQSSGHALKGLVSNFMHDTTTGLALRLEKMGRNDEWEDIENVVDQMKHAAERLLESLTAALEEPRN